MLTSRGLGTVLGDLAAMGFNARWGVLGAANVGAPHQRDRIWIVAKWRGQLPYTQHDRIGWWEQQQESIEKETTKLANPNHQGVWSCGRGNGWQLDREDRAGIDNKTRSGKYAQPAEIGEPQNLEKEISNSTGIGLQGQGQHEQSINPTQSGNWKANYVKSIGSSDFWTTEPNVGRVVNGLASRMDRLKAIGNGQVPLCAATAWRILSGD